MLSVGTYKTRELSGPQKDGIYQSLTADNRFRHIPPRWTGFINILMDYIDDGELSCDSLATENQM